MLGAEGLAAPDRRRIAASAGVPVTTFLARKGEGFEARYQTPTKEVAFSGHGTLAAVGALARAGGLPGLGTTFETSEGTLRVFRDATRPTVGWMILAPEPLRAPATEPQAIAAVLGLVAADLDPTLGPTRAGRTLIVPVRSLEVLARAQPTRDLGALGHANEATHLYVTTFETDDPLSDVRCRDFAAGPEAAEDAVTAESAGALGVYLHRSGRGKPLLTMSQGTEVGRPGRALVVVEEGSDDGTRVMVGGPTAPMESIEVMI